jgi:hypothetical protein
MTAKATVVEMNRDAKELPELPENMEHELREFSGGLSYDQARIIEKTQECLEEGVRQFFKAGLGLILMHRHEEGKTFTLIIEQYFPGITLRTAKNYMQFSPNMIKHPAFQPFMKVRGGYSKALTVLHACIEAEIEDADELVHKQQRQAVGHHQTPGGGRHPAVG